MWRLYPEAQVLLTNNIDSVNEYLQRKFLLKKLLRLLVIEGADGSGKTTIIRKLKEELKRRGLKYLHNEIKRRRQENETLLEFREGVTNRRNQNLIEGLIHRIKHEGGCEIVITDKSPYVEFFYQKTKWNHERLNTYKSHQLMKKVFASSEVIEASLAIHLKNSEAWNNYIRWEETLKDKSFETMSRETYQLMKANFEKYAPKLYKNHIFVQIQNDENSWKKVWKIIEEKLL